MAVLGWVVAAVAVAAAVVVNGRAAARRRAAAEALTAATRDLDRLRDQADEAAASAGSLHRALDAIPQGVVIGDGDGTVTYSNRAAADFIAARHGEALVEAAMRELLADAVAGRSVSRTIELFGPPRRVLAVSAAPLPGATHAGLIVVDDVSERRRLDAVRRDFVANISHELKTPIGALGLLAETLQDEPDPEVSRRLAERMVNEAFRVGHTIDDLLELSRIEGGEGPVPDTVAVEQVMAEAVERVGPAAELRSVRVRVEAPSRRLTVQGDRRQLVSALTNLVDNAVKYSELGAEVTVQARAVPGPGTPAGVRVELAVADHGLGIPARDLDRIFERFYRVDQARSRNTGGTGLGLAIVRHVMANHGGEVTVRSHEGQGSTFTLSIPAGPGPVALAG